MKTTTKRTMAVSGLLATAALFSQCAFAQRSTPPVSPAEMEGIYTAAIENRTDKIVNSLGLTDAVKSNTVHEIIIEQYRVMRARDELINAKLEAEGKEANYANRAAELESESKLIHKYFIARLSKILSPEDIEKIKDKMTYDKVKITYDAYSAIVPGLTAADKTKILELLKTAREKAIDGGSASEKSDIFQEYKDQINDYLNGHGHDVAKAYKEWEAKQAAEKTTAANSAPDTNGAQ